MEPTTVIGLVVLVVVLGGGGVLLYLYLFPTEGATLRTMLNSGGRGGLTVEDEGFDAKGRKTDLSRSDLDKYKQIRKKTKKPPLTLEQKFFQAGVFTKHDKAEFKRLRVVIPCVTTPLLTFGMWSLMGAEWSIIGIVLGLLVGMQIPFSILDRRIKNRGEDIMYYLPLVIEQIAIGVSSSLDIGPCIHKVISMADERDTHNVVTELLKFAHGYVRSGASLEDALMEVGKLSGHTELKHTFMSLSQVARHGGEITRQLQELADAVANQRETKIDAKIKKLELAATGPVALVFMGFLVILLIGFGLQVTAAFN